MPWEGPGQGLDPPSTKRVLAVLEQLRKENGSCILLSTHILQEVEAVASRVLFIHQGHIVFDGSLAELHSKGSNLDAIFSELTAESESLSA